MERISHKLGKEAGLAKWEVEGKWESKVFLWRKGWCRSLTINLTAAPDGIISPISPEHATTQSLPPPPRERVTSSFFGVTKFLIFFLA